MEIKELARLTEGLRDGLRPIKRITCDVWADENRRLTSESSAEPGRWRTDRTPFLRQILVDLSPTSLVNEVIVVKGVQLGFTESGLCCVGTYIDIDPCPIMYVMPTIDTARAISKDRIEPMISNCPALQKKIRPADEKGANNTTMVKAFPGGRLILAGANSAASLRSRPVRVLVLDEVDGYPINASGEGSPVRLAEKRQSTFGDKRKTYKLSTPAREATSVIQREYELTEQCKFHIPCPRCACVQHLEFGNLKWVKGKYDEVVYVCSECEEEIDENQKADFLPKGIWIATVPANKTARRRGYHINSLYSPLGWLSWGQIAEQYDKALGDVNEMIVFTNTILGETWKDSGEAPEWQNLYNRREHYAINKAPAHAAFITMGVDVQGDRLELEIVAWCKNKESYSLDYRVLLGDPKKPEVWAKLDVVISEQFEREDGAWLPIKLTAIDAGYETTHVYNFCRRHSMDRVIPVAGKANLGVIFSAPRAVDTNRRGKAIGKTKVYGVGVDVLKSELYGLLRLERNEDDTYPTGYCHFPEYDQQYFKGLTAERLVRKLVNGYPRYEWHKHYERNEPLDLRNYARAAASICRLDRMTAEDFDVMIAQAQPRAATPTTAAVNKENPVAKAKKKREKSIW